MNPTRPAGAYELEPHPVAITPAADGGWLPWCPTCSAREGDWTTGCRSWPAGVPVRLLGVGQIAQTLAAVRTELARRPA